VWVYPVIDDNIEIEINPADLKIDTYRASAARAGSTSTPPIPRCASPTCRPGIVVASQHDRSQHKNRAIAMNMLKARLYEAEMRRREAAASAEHSGQDRHRLGPPDPLLRPAALPDGQGPAHRRGLDRAGTMCSTARSIPSSPRRSPSA
jgi:hypothetical protein